MRKFFCIIIVVLIMCVPAGCMNANKIGGDEMMEILKDVKFEKGFGAMDISSANGYGVKRELLIDESKPGRDWLLAQWGTKHSFEHDMIRKESSDDKGNKIVKFFNDAKEVIAYPGEGKVKLNAYASREYVVPRVSGEDWIHLLLEQVFTDSQRVPFAKMNKLEMSLKFTVNKCENKMSEEEYNPSIHAGQISWFITVENPESKELTPEGRPDYMWFGLPIYDNRSDGMEGGHQMDWGTMKLIYSVGKAQSLGEIVKIGSTYNLKYDILPQVKIAFDIAQKNGSLPGAEFEKMVIGSMNLGWELPGTFDAEFTIEDISIAYSK